MKQKADAAIKHEKELEAVFSALVEAIIVTDSTMVVKEINTAALRLFKIGKSKGVGSRLSEITDNGDLHDIASETLQLKSGRKKKLLIKEQIPSEDKFDNHKFTSRNLYFQVNTSYIETGDNDIRMILVLHDITQVETLERIRKDFVANVSHELKTPVTSILGFVETLKNGAINNRKDTLEFLDIIQEQSQRLGAIIKDLLSLSALESYENMDIETEPLLFSEVISSVLKICSRKIQRKNIEIRVNYSEDFTAQANSLLLEQALVNLVDNSVKYCPPGSTITLKGAQFPDYSLIRLADNGPGIPEKDIPRVFERFYTVDKARSRELGGTGLGLAIVKHIVLAHKGQISINSSRAKGVEFIIRLPL